MTAGVIIPIRGDFDHDGKTDVVKFVAKPKGDYQLIVRRKRAGRPVSIITSVVRSDMPNLFLTIAKPGRWRTWCGKGGGSVSAPCPRAFVDLYGMTIDFGTEGSTEFVAIWTGRKFTVVQLSG